MRIFTAVAVVALAGSAVAGTQPPPPVMDVHLHALPADAQGPPPLAMCTPLRAWPVWDPATPYQLAAVDPKQRIEAAPFLSEQQKRDILYNNAARFLRLSDAEIARHHGR
jgi:hypothetical protein